MKTISLAILSIFSGLFLKAQTLVWTAPEAESSKTNPLLGNVRDTKKGESIFKKVCTTCHGADGSGNGAAAKELKPPPADLRSQSVQGQTDGALFWKISEGRNTMAGYKLSLSATQRWQLVNYLRTLKTTDK